jgi:hypothetical protein
MKKSGSRLAQFFAVAMLSVSSVVLMPASGGAAVGQGDLSGITAAVDSAIASAKAGLPQGASQAQVDAAVAAALSSITQSLISSNSSANPMIVAEAVIAAADRDGASPQAIGAGLGAAALAESPSVGLEIADAVGATAPNGATQAFQATANGAGTTQGQSLASAAGTYESIGAGGGQNGGGNSQGQNFFGGGNSQGQNGGGGGGGCRNPSCT